MLPDPFRTWLTKVGWEIALAVALAAALAISTGGTAAQALRYFAAFSGLGSLVQAILAFGRSRPLDTRLSEWDEATVLATLAAVAHLIANYMNKST